MEHGFLFTLAGAATLLLGACSTGIVVEEPVHRQGYVNGDLEYSSRHGTLQTKVFGSPFGMRAPAFKKLVTGHMKGANRGRVFTYSTGDAKSDPYYVVLVFNAPRATREATLCKSPDRIATPAGGGPLTLTAGFCIGDTLLSAARGHVGAVNDIGAPGFRELIRAVTLSLFPANDYWDMGDDSRLIM